MLWGRQYGGSSQIQNFLTGTIPTEIGQLKKLSTLGLYQKSFDKMIPSAIDNLSSLSVCYLDGNALTGTIPSTIGSLKKLHDFRLSNKKLISSIPTEIGLMRTLEMLY
jgi:Leucine-rich repeat (LRR) protein